MRSKAAARAGGALFNFAVDEQPVALQMLSHTAQRWRTRAREHLGLSFSVDCGGVRVRTWRRRSARGCATWCCCFGLSCRHTGSSGGAGKRRRAAQECVAKTAGSEGRTKGSAWEGEGLGRKEVLGSQRKF
jgi:hypothetical protein